MSVFNQTRILHGYLESVKVHLLGLLVVEDDHSIVVERKDRGEQDAAEGLCSGEINEAVDDRLGREHDHKQGEPVEEKRNGLLRAHVELLVIADPVDRLNFFMTCQHGTPFVFVYLEGPREAGQGKERGEEELLVVNDKLGHALASGGIGEALECVLGPGEEWHGVNIGVLAVDVGNGVVLVVLLLPPVDREALEDVADEETSPVVVLAVLKHLVVQKVVCEPAALLPEEGEKEPTEDGCFHN